MSSVRFKTTGEPLAEDDGLRRVGEELLAGRTAVLPGDFGGHNACGGLGGLGGLGGGGLF